MSELDGVAPLVVSALIVPAVRVLREAFPQMADGSLRAKRLTIAVSVGLGALAGALGYGPVLEPGGVAGRVLGGIGAGCIAYVVAGFAGPKARLEER